MEPTSSVTQPLRSNELDGAEIAGLIGRDDAVIIEIGANDGKHTSLFLDACPRAQVYCFEPDARAIRKWRERVTDPRAVLFETAVGTVDGEVTFHVSGGKPRPGYPEGWDMSGSIHRPKVHLERWPRITFDTTVTVPSVRLDTWAAAQGIERVDFIWADVQGAERQVIEGGAETLARTRFFFTEYYDVEMYEGQLNLAAIAALLPGFELLIRFGHDALFRRRG